MLSQRQTIMTILGRYKRLTFWNKFGVWGTAASIIALLIPIACSESKDTPSNSQKVGDDNSGNVIQIQNSSNVTVNSYGPQRKSPEAKFHISLTTTLRDLYMVDFPMLGLGKRCTITTNDNKLADIEGYLHMDFIARSRFMSFYVPKSDAAFETCAVIIQIHQELLTGLEKDFVFEDQPLSEMSDRSTNLKFSGRIYIYHETDFSLQQQSALDEYASKKGLSIRLRDDAYRRKRIALAQIGQD